jgi:hypothetical protein
MAATAGIEPLALGDPRAVITAEADKSDIYQRTWGLAARVDSTVTFEEYVHWAKIERAEENEANRVYKEMRGPTTVKTVIKGRFSKGIHHEEKKRREAALVAARGNIEGPSSGTDAEKDKSDAAIVPAQVREGAVSEEEWRTASRALRTASWGTMFYLITTDILGWSSTP